MANPYKEQQRNKQAGFMDECKRLISEGKRVEAVKLYRMKTGANLPRAMQDLGLR